MIKLKRNRAPAGMPTVKHRLFFEFLLISPSYYLAYQIRSKRKKTKPAELPDEFQKVLNLYDRVGNIYTTTFDKWWDSGGVEILAPERKKAKLVFQVDVSKPKERTLQEFKDFMDGINFKPFNPLKSQIHLLTNKIRMSTLKDRLDLVEIRSRYGDNKSTNQVTKTPYWEIALQAKENNSNLRYSKPLTLIERDKYKRKSNKPKKAYMTMLISKNLKEALCISENAARGIFPSKESTFNLLDFNFELIKKNQFKQTKMLADQLLDGNDLGMYPYMPPKSKTVKLRDLNERKKDEIQERKMLKKYRKDFLEKGYADVEQKIPGTNQYRKSRHVRRILD